MAAGGRRSARAGSPPAGDSAAAKQGAVSRLIQIYANRGHLIADIDPLGLTVRPVPKVLGLDYLGLTEADLDTEFLTGSRHEAIKPRLKLREIIAQLKHIYCGTIGAEFAHVSDETERLWLQERFQVGRMHQAFSNEARQRDPAPPDDGGRPRTLPGHEIPGAEALLAGRRRQPHPAARGRDPDRRLAGHRGHRLRHGAPRAPERAGERARQVARGAVLGIRGQVRPQEAQRLRRRQVPQGLLVRREDAGGQRACRAGLQSRRTSKW